MKLSLLEYLKCPRCHARFECSEETEKNGEVFEGKLACTSCSAKFPIINYVPRLIENYNYSHSWGVMWKETGKLHRDSCSGVPYHYNAIHGEYSEENTGDPGKSPFGFGWPKRMEGQKVLEIGPGTGNLTEVLMDTGAEIFAVEMSDAIDTFSEEMLIHENLHVIQADINDEVVPLDFFDRILFYQVLQHTPSPPETLKNIAKFLKRGGELAVTSYGGEEFNPWYYGFTKRIDDKKAWKLIEYWIPKLTPIKYQILKAAKVTRSQFLFRALTYAMGPIDPRNIYFRTLEGEMDDWFFGQIWNKYRDRELIMKHVVINTFDKITPTYTNVCRDHETMKQWLEDAGFIPEKVWGESGVRARGIRK